MEYNLIWENQNNRFEESFNNISDLEMRISILDNQYDKIQIIDSNSEEWCIVYFTNTFEIIKGLYGKQ